MDNKEFKERFLESLYENNRVKATYSKKEYRTRCPYCGDSDNPDHVHFYLKVDTSDNSGIVGHCFKCESGGPLDKEMMELLHIDPSLISEVDAFNKNSTRADRKNFLGEESQLFFDYKLPTSVDTNKLRYIENRIGVKFTNEDISNMKMVFSLYEFMELNDIKMKFDDRVLNTIDRFYVGFLSSGNSYILLRNVTDKEFVYKGSKLSNWVKLPLSKESGSCKCFYSISNEVDILTKDEITVNITEGIVDILSIYYNLGQNKPNTMNIAVTGKYYEQILLYLLSLGIVGSNVTLNIYADNDEVFNKKAKNPTTEEYFRKNFEKMFHLYGHVNLYYNTYRKDFGYPREDIMIKKIRLY